MTTALHTEPQAPFAEPNPYAAPSAESRGFSVSSLVLGVVSVIAGITFVVPIIGLVLGLMALTREPASRTLAIWGVVLNAVMLAGALLAAFGFAVLGLAMLPFAFL